MEKHEIQKKDFIINVHHIGGIESCGPTELLNNLKDDIFWTFYDAEETAFDDFDVRDKKYKIINKCVGKEDGKTNFYITADPSASSILKSAKSAANYIIPATKTKWGDHTKITSTIKMDINKLDTLIENKEVPNIDFLSVDAQGADLDIIKGCEKNLDNVLGILCEVEFSRLYEKQPLFFDTHKYLNEKDFKLYILYNSQYFNHMLYEYSKRSGGFLTVGETLFLKKPEVFYKIINSKSATLKEKNIATINCLKLAGIGIVFNQMDFSKDIINKLKKYTGISLQEFDNKLQYIDYISMLNLLDKNKLRLAFLKGEIEKFDERGLQR